MSGSIFLETVRRNWRGMLLWGLGIALMAAYIVLIIPDSKTLQQYSSLIKTLPSVLINAIGGGDAASIGTPAGFMAYGFFGWIMLVMATYGVLAGLNITANEEDRGIMDVLLSLPLPRWRIVLEKFLAYCVIIAVIVLFSVVVLIWGIQNSVALNSIPISRVLESSLNFIPSTLLVMAFTAFVAVIVRRRTTAAAIAAVFVIASWFIDTLGRSAPSTDALRTLSFFRYYDSSGVMQNGLVLANVFGLLGVVVLLLVGTVWLFQRRDVGV